MLFLQILRGSIAQSLSAPDVCTVRSWEFVYLMTVEIYVLFEIPGVFIGYGFSPICICNMSCSPGIDLTICIYMYKRRLANIKATSCIFCS